MSAVTAVLTGHREGIVCGPSVRNFVATVERARAAGIDVQCVAVLDRADRITRSIFKRELSSQARILETDFGDPGSARGAAVDETQTKYICFLDADDLWSLNWIEAAHSFVCQQDRPLIAHSEVNQIFGDAEEIYFHADSEAPGFEIELLRAENYWDAMAFAEADIYRQIPFKPNRFDLGYGIEDWHWACETIAAGIQHKPVPGTMHFKRRRNSTRTLLSYERDVVAWPSTLSRYSYYRDNPANV